MRTKLPYDRLRAVLPKELTEALESEGFSISGSEVKRRASTADIDTLQEGERAVVRYVSTRDVDRDGEVLDPGGCVLDAFMQNPVVMWAHDYSEPPIGKAEWIKTDSYGVKSKTVYAETERAEEVWQLIRGGFLQSASVGFIPLARCFQGDPEWGATVDKLNRRWKADLLTEGARIVTTKWALIEYSDVPIPANPNALIEAVAKGLHISANTMHSMGVGMDAVIPEIVKEITPDLEPRRIIIPVTAAMKRVVVPIVPKDLSDQRIIAMVTDSIDRLRGRV